MKSEVYKYAKAAGVFTVALTYLLASPVSHAANVKNTMNVKLQVNGACVLTVVNMDFGSLTQVMGTETASSYVTVVCNQLSTIYLSFLPTFSVANTSRNSTLTSGTGNKINFSMALQGYFGVLPAGATGYTYINGKLAATPGASAGIYQSTETLYVIY